MSNLRFIATSTLSRIATAIREKDPDLGNPQMSPEEMSNYINTLDPHGYRFIGGEGGYALNLGTNLRAKFQNNATVMYPVISEQVTDMQQAFNNCRKIVGEPMCNNGVVYGFQMYRDCWNLTGEPTPSYKLQSLIDMREAYYNCVNITGNATCGPNVVNMAFAYWNCSNLNGNVLEIGPNVNNLRQTFYNCQNLAGTIPDGLDPAVIRDSYQAFRWCHNIKGNAICSDIQTDMTEMYLNCYDLDGSPACGNLINTMLNAYSNCYSLTGTAACGPKVVQYAFAYYECQSLEKAYCGPLVTNMHSTFYNCQNLKGAAACGFNVTVGINAYRNCYNLQLGYVGNKITDVRSMFYGCNNISGTVLHVVQPTYITEEFYNCCKLQGVYYPGQPNYSYVANAFYREDHNTRLNIVFAQAAGLEGFRTRGPAMFGCDFSAQVVTNEVASLPMTYSNGAVYGYKNYNTVRQAYNEEYNVWLYALA